MGERKERTWWAEVGGCVICGTGKYSPSQSHMKRQGFRRTGGSDETHAGGWIGTKWVPLCQSQRREVSSRGERCTMFSIMQCNDMHPLPDHRLGCAATARGSVDTPHCILVNLFTRATSQLSSPPSSQLHCADGEGGTQQATYTCMHPAAPPTTPHARTTRLAAK